MMNLECRKCRLIHKWSDFHSLIPKLWKLFNCFTILHVLFSFTNFRFVLGSLIDRPSRTLCLQASRITCWSWPLKICIGSVEIINKVWLHDVFVLLNRHFITTRSVLPRINFNFYWNFISYSLLNCRNLGSLLTHGPLDSVCNGISL